MAVFALKWDHPLPLHCHGALKKWKSLFRCCCSGRTQAAAHGARKTGDEAACWGHLFGSAAVGACQPLPLGRGQPANVTCYVELQWAYGNGCPCGLRACRSDATAGVIDQALAWHEDWRRGRDGRPKGVPAALVTFQASCFVALDDTTLPWPLPDAVSDSPILDMRVCA